ncbi:MAG: M36 family metallopeptidase, partial [Betaproteobacteria bacterium]
MQPAPLRYFAFPFDRAIQWLTVLFVSVLPVSARVLPNIDAHGDARPVPTAVQEKIRQRTDAIAKAHLEERLGVPAFLALRPGKAALPRDELRTMTTEAAARAHLKNFADLYLISTAEIDAAPLHHVEDLFNGAKLARFTNQKDGIAVFRESVTILMNSSGDATAISGWLGTTANTSVLSSNKAAPFRLSPADAVATVLRDYNVDGPVASRLIRADQSSIAESPSDFAYQRFLLPIEAGENPMDRMSEPARTKPVWFRLPEGLVPAHYVELQMSDTTSGSLDYYSYVIAADDGRILFRNNQTADAVFTYKVWADATGSNVPQTGPQGRNGTPHPTGQDDGYQAPFVPQSVVTLQSGPISTADPWLPPAATRTIGNNVEAWANHYAPPIVPPATSAPADGFDADPAECNMSAPFLADFHACVSAANSFEYTFNPEAEPKANKEQSAAAVVNLFYVTNWLHDWYYDAGFREIDGNAQANNFGRGGLGGDSMKAQAQDNAGFNNANMSTPADGGRPRMRMYLFSGNEAAAVTVTPPASNLPVGTAPFGPAIFDISLSVVLVDDGSGAVTDGCQPFANNVSGKIALVDRGTCTFETKALNAQNAGALGLIVANNVSGVIDMGDDPAITTPITVPVLMISLDDGANLKTSLQSGAVTARLRRLIGADRDGALDNSIIAHEWGHYISNRLIGDANGLATVQSRGLGEGWADFH